MLGFPEDDDDDYHFLPRSMSDTRRPPVDPIGPSEFYEYCYHLHPAGELTSRYWRLFTPQYLLKGLPDDRTLPLIPRKVHELVWNDGERGPFWDCM
jgi:hypothetical protein